MRYTGSAGISAARAACVWPAEMPVLPLNPLGAYACRLGYPTVLAVPGVRGHGWRAASPQAVAANVSSLNHQRSRTSP